MQQRTIIFTVKEDKVTNKVNIIDHDAVIGYEGENGATLVKFNLPETWLAEPEKNYQICIQSADGKKYLTDILDEPEFALPSAVMLKGSLFIQLLTTDGEGKIIKKTEVCKCIVGSSIVGEEIMLSDEGLRLPDEVAKSLNDAVEMAKEIKRELEDKTNNISGLHAAYIIGFDSNNKPIRCGKIQNGIGAGLFTGNKELKTVYIPKQLLSINSGAFVGCDNLTDIYINNLRDSHKPGINAGSMPSGVDVKLHYIDDADYDDWTIIDSLVETIVKFVTYETTVDSLEESVGSLSDSFSTYKTTVDTLKSSSFSIFTSADQFWTDSSEVNTWAFKPNSIYNVSYAKFDKLKDIPENLSAANMAIITFGGNTVKSPSKANDLYSEETGVNGPPAGVTQFLFANAGQIYQRYKDGSTYEYGEWRTIINKDNLETFIKQSSYIKTLEARIAALEKNN